MVWRPQTGDRVGGFEPECRLEERKQTDTITGHGTQKPVELMRRPLLNHTERGGLVYDPFLGSGSTLIAAEDTGRACYGLELSPAYVDVIVERWQKLTGRKAVLEGDGRSFDELERGARGSASGGDRWRGLAFV